MAEIPPLNTNPELTAQLNERYQGLAGDIDRLQVFDFETADDYQRHPAYLGGNKYQAAFSFEASSDGRKYVARVPNLTRQSWTPEGAVLRATAYARRREALQRGVGIPGLGQVVALDPDKQVIVTEYVPGKLLSTMGRDDFYPIPRAQWLRIWDAVQQGSRHGIAFDEGYKMNNLLYDKDNGFTVIDYEIADDSQNSDELYEANIAALAQVRAWSAMSVDQLAGDN